MQKLAAEHFDIILMDVQMPIMDGYKTTETIRDREKQNKARNIPIIGMTAHALQGDRERCVSAGMDDYIAKPFDPAALSNLLKKYLQSGENSTGEIKIA